MKNNFLCPKCRESFFNTERKLITLRGVLKGDYFSVSSIIELKNQKGEFGGEFLFSGITFESGAKVDFLCPHCGFDLTADFDPELCEMIHVDEEGDEKAYIISKIAGTEMAFVVCKNKKEILESYGKEKEKYLDRFRDYFHMWGKY
jgi:hypothetical protein